MYRHILVPLDNTDLSIPVVGGAVALARPLGARITFFHVVEQTEDALGGDLELLRVTSPEVYDYARGGRARELLAKAEAGARAFGVACDARWTSGRKPAPAIVQAARALGCDLIYMASHAHGGKLGMALASDTLTVVLSAGLPVLVATAGEPAPPERAIAVIRDEHRAIAAVIHAATRLLGDAVTAGQAVDAGAMNAVLKYLRGFPLTQHHPKEERHLFPLLRARTHAMDAELDELERQHVRDAALLQELGGLVAALEGAADAAARVAATGALQEAIGRYATLHWEHMGREEAVILPAAQQYLQADDWVSLNAAFAEPASLQRPGELSGLDYHHLLSRIV
jgi:nucleotide-binding universal stress UspA family protein/hemerythrin-like domain-containing protein